MTVDPDAWGVETKYRDYQESWHEAPARTVELILEAMGADEKTPSQADGPLVVTTGESDAIDGNWKVTTEAGESFEGRDLLLPNLPLGYHQLESSNGTRRLIVTPKACPAFGDKRWWGWTVQLYAMRSASSWGIGDLGDLASFAQHARSDGADFGIVNPLHAALPGLPQQASPYYPSSREYRNPLYIDVTRVPGAEQCADQLEAVSNAARDLNENHLIERDSIWQLKMQALETIWQTTQQPNEFEEWSAAQGRPLDQYATFCVLFETHGSGWRTWPEEMRDPRSLSVSRFAAEHSDRVRFHKWLQWLLDTQLAHASSILPFVQDLAIGADPSGADSWLWQQATASGIRVGAPPDRFNTRGQDWGFEPLDPWRLRATNYEPFIRTLRASMVHGGGIRIDHVMGLFRLYWIPEGASAAEGTYVRYPWKDLLSIVALESARCQGFVVGEDLGTVEPYMRTELAARNILSYKLMWFQKSPPPDFPQLALGAVTTHDLPTIAGLWTGRDIEIQRNLGLAPNEAATQEIYNRILAWLDLDSSATVEDVIEKTHAVLATAPSSVVSATIEDALGLQERPNYPGTTAEWPNWSVALPAKLEQIVESSGYKATVAAFQAARG